MMEQVLRDISLTIYSVTNPNPKRSEVEQKQDKPTPTNI